MNVYKFWQVVLYDFGYEHTCGIKFTLRIPSAKSLAKFFLGLLKERESIQTYRLLTVTSSKSGILPWADMVAFISEVESFPEVLFDFFNLILF